MANTSPYESYEQQCLVAKLQELYPGILIEAHPLEGALQSAMLKVGIAQKTAEKAARLLGAFAKQQGYQKGSFDLFLPEHRVFIDVKRTVGGRPAPEQLERKLRLEAAGYACIFAYGAVDGINQLTAIIK